MIRKSVIFATALVFATSFSGAASAQYAGGRFNQDELNDIRAHCDSLVPLGNPAATSSSDDTDDSAYSHISLRECRDAGFVN